MSALSSGLDSVVMVVVTCALAMFIVLLPHLLFLVARFSAWALLRDLARDFLVSLFWLDSARSPCLRHSSRPLRRTVRFWIFKPYRRLNVYALVPRSLFESPPLRSSSTAFNQQIDCPVTHAQHTSVCARPPQSRRRAFCPVQMMLWRTWPNLDHVNAVCTRRTGKIGKVCKEKQEGKARAANYLKSSLSQARLPPRPSQLSRPERRDVVAHGVIAESAPFAPPPLPTRLSAPEKMLYIVHWYSRAGMVSISHVVAPDSRLLL